MDFESIFKIVVETDNSEAAFSREECQALYDALYRINAKEIVEIGVQFGRSTTVLGMYAKSVGAEVVAVDNWKEDVSPAAKANIEKQIAKYNMPVDLWSMDSVSASSDYKNLIEGKTTGEIDLIHIDGDHTFEGVLADCKKWLPMVRCGGLACFDDYGHDSLPGVYQGVSEFLKTSEGKKWLFVGRYGNKLGIFQKI